MSDSFWAYISNVWDDDKEFPAPLGTVALISRNGWHAPLVAKCIFGTEDDGYFSGVRCWYVEEDETYITEATHWMPIPPPPPSTHNPEKEE